MSVLTVSGASLGTALQELLQADDIAPGSEASYQLCKTIYAYHPFGAKLVDNPIRVAQSQKRDITIQRGGVEERLRKAFEDQWKRDGATRAIRNAARLGRIYGAGTLGIVEQGKQPSTQLDLARLSTAKMAFSTWDPLNTAGSLVLNQDPNSIDFNKVRGIRVAGSDYHRSRTVTYFNEDPLYIEYTSSAFGYVGRSVYQRALFPLKSYLNTLVANDLVALKCGALVAKIKGQGSIIDQVAQAIGAAKRAMIKTLQTGNVLQIDLDEEIESLNLQNLEAPLSTARRNIIEDCASASGTPSIFLLEEALGKGFSEGTEDAKHAAQFIDDLRETLDPLYTFMDEIVARRAWNPDFYAALQRDISDYRGVEYDQAFYMWWNSFEASWPNLLEEPDSEKVKVSDVKLKAAIAVAEVLLPICDPENKAKVIEFLADAVNEDKLLFASHLELDYEALATYEPPQPEGEPGEDGAPVKMDRADSERSRRAVSRALDNFSRAVEALDSGRKVRLEELEVA